MVKFLQIYLLIMILTLCSCKAEAARKYQRDDIAMGTHLSVTFFHNNSEEAESILDQCFDLAADLEDKVSSTVEDSLINQLNREKQLNITDPFVQLVLDEAINIAKESQGAFDPALYSLIKLWGWGLELDEYSVPEHNAIIKAISQTGYQHIQVNGSNYILEHNIEIDLGGIAKGAIIDQIALLLDNNGVTSYLVNGGGDISVGGQYNGVRDWNVAVTDPFQKESYLGVIGLSDNSIVTSGDYERFFTDDNGKRYHHILDPATGYPTDNGVHSVTVVTDGVIRADGLCTAVFVMGIEKGLKLVESLPDTEAIIVAGSVENQQIIYSSGVTGIKTGENRYKFTLKKD